MKARIVGLTLTALAVTGFVTACSDTNESTSTSSATSTDEISADPALDPCPAGPTAPQESCHPVAIAELENGTRAAVAVEVNAVGRPILAVTVDDASTTKLTAPIVIPHRDLTSPPRADGLAKLVHLYDLDGRSGAEIVVPVGDYGAGKVYQVFTVRDGELVEVSAPGSTMNITLGTGLWSFVEVHTLTRVLCRPGGIGIGLSASGAVTDFVSKPGTGAGEAGEWVVDGKRTVPQSDITDMSVGSRHFKCNDVRVADLTKTASSTTTTASCDRSTDMSATVRSAIAKLPVKNGWEWQTTADTSDLDPCRALSFATTTVEMATNSSPVAILLFNKGRFVGPASTCFPPIQEVASSGDDSVAVTYRYPNEGDSNAGMTGRATLTFRWDGSSVVKTGDVPARLTQLAGCTP